MRLCAKGEIQLVADGCASQRAKATRQNVRAPNNVPLKPAHGECSGQSRFADSKGRMPCDSRQHGCANLLGNRLADPAVGRLRQVKGFAQLGNQREVGWWAVWVLRLHHRLDLLQRRLDHIVQDTGLQDS